MKYLVDVNVLSEPTRPEPSLQVIEWLRDNERELAIDPIILGEVRFGIYRLPAGKRRIQLERWFAQRVSGLLCLPWDAVIGLRWADLSRRLAPRWLGHVVERQHDRGHGPCLSPDNRHPQPEGLPESGNKNHRSVCIKKTPGTTARRSCLRFAISASLRRRHK